MITYRVTPLSIAVHLESESPVFGESSVHVCIDDEAEGPFIVLKQYGDGAKPEMVSMDIEQLEAVARVARELMDAQPKEKRGRGGV